MTKEEFNSRISAIGTCTDDVERRELLATLGEDVGKDYDDHAAAVAERDRLTGDNERLRDANMKMFVRLGDPNKPAPANNNPDNEKKDRPKFEDLFNEKGGIK